MRLASIVACSIDGAQAADTSAHAARPPSATSASVSGRDSRGGRAMAPAVATASRPSPIGTHLPGR